MDIFFKRADQVTSQGVVVQLAGQHPVLV